MSIFRGCSEITTLAQAGSLRVLVQAFLGVLLIRAIFLGSYGTVSDSADMLLLHPVISPLGKGLRFFFWPF